MAKRVRKRKVAKKAARDLVVETALAATVLDSVPLVGTVIKLGRAGYQALQERRFNRFWRYIEEHDGDPEELRLRVEQAMNDDNALGVAFVAAARAATEAFDTAVIESIALLARKFLRTGTPSRVVYRDILEMLVTLERDEFSGLRDAVHAVQRVPRVRGGGEGEPAAIEPGTLPEGHHDLRESPFVAVYLGPDPTTGSWRWYAIQTQRNWDLAHGEVAIRLVEIFERLGKQHFWTTTQEHPSRARKSTALRSTMDLLAEIMPLPQRT